MPRIRKVEIANFRVLRAFAWTPLPGINCLIGPGDSGKSTILDAIDLCLGARRTAQFTDADFHNLDVSKQIEITLTIGELDEPLKNMEYYGIFLRGFKSTTGEIEDEPEDDAETVLSLRLTVASDLEPNWTLFSERSAAQNLIRNLNWADRARTSPTRISAAGDYNLGWRRGSVLNRLSDERADPSMALAKATRDARSAFGDEANEQLANVLGVVTETARQLGIPVGENVQALLDMHSVSISGGSISLHDDAGVPLRGMGLGSTRLLIAGLQRKAAEKSKIILVDELEHGLEPHRIIRFLGALGSKEAQPPLQAFITTHSPVALRELSGRQLFVVRRRETAHEARHIGDQAQIQGAIRTFPDAFLAPSVLICEGASEVGFVRGIDQFRVARKQVSISGLGVALVDGGGDTSQLFRRAQAFQSLGYRTAILRDSDVLPDKQIEDGFRAGGGAVISWRNGRALEDELFLELSDGAVSRLVEFAVEQLGENLIDAHIKSASDGKLTLEGVRIDMLLDRLSSDARTTLGKAAKNKSGWFKTVSLMERAAREIIAGDLDIVDWGFRQVVETIFAWAGGENV